MRRNDESFPQLAITKAHQPGANDVPQPQVFQRVVNPPLVVFGF
jgi:hypothetical protein